LSTCAQRPNSRNRFIIWFAAIGLLNALGANPGNTALGQSNRAAEAERAVLTVDLSSIDKAYAEAKFVFDLVGDSKGYQTFKETIDVFLTGVETGKPCTVRVIATPDGLVTVGTLAVASDGDFKKFARNLWDVDVKSAPPPEPALMPQVPAAVRTKLSSLKLQSNERLIFGLGDGFMRYEKGHVQIGETLEAVRLGHAGSGGAAPGSEKAILTLRLDGKAAAPDKRRAAFEKARERILSRLKKKEDDSEAGFALQKAFLDYQLAKFELLFSESSQAEIVWTTSHEKKRSEIKAEIVPAKGTSLEKDFEQWGKSPDEFAGVSAKDAVLSSSINAPVNAGLAKAFKSVVRQGREFARSRIDESSKLETGQKAVDRDIAELIFDVMDDVVSLPAFNGFVRTWSNGDGTLTTVGAARISDGQKFVEVVQKIHGRESVGRKGSGGREAQVEVHKVIAHQWRQDFEELFDKEGSVYIGTSKNAVWYAVGEKALERLEQSIQEAEAKGAGTQNTAFDVQAEMRPLAEVWSNIHSRRPQGAARKVARNSKEKEKTDVARAASVIADLDLPKIAKEAYHGGHDAISLSLKKHDEKAVLSAQFDEGTLRFVGQTLSRFVKDNLEE
jgi:hypothetical protein